MPSDYVLTNQQYLTLKLHRTDFFATCRQQSREHISDIVNFCLFTHSTRYRVTLTFIWTSFSGHLTNASQIFTLHVVYRLAIWFFSCYTRLCSLANCYLGLSAIWCWISSIQWCFRDFFCCQKPPAAASDDHKKAVGMNQNNSTAGQKTKTIS